MYLLGSSLAAALLDSLLNSLRVWLEHSVTPSSPGFFGPTIVFQHPTRFVRMSFNVFVASLKALPYDKSTTQHFAQCCLARDKCVLAR